MVRVLEPFKDATKFFSHESVPTIGVVSPIIKRLLDHHLQPAEEDGDNEVVAVFKTIVIEDLQTRWHTMTYSVPDAILLSAYLDPRTKDFAFVGDVTLRDSMLRKAYQRAAHHLSRMSAPSTPTPSRLRWLAWIRMRRFVQSRIGWQIYSAKRCCRMPFAMTASESR